MLTYADVLFVRGYLLRAIALNPTHVLANSAFSDLQEIREEEEEEEEEVEEVVVEEEQQQKQGDEGGRRRGDAGGVGVGGGGDAGGVGVGGGWCGNGEKLAGVESMAATTAGVASSIRSMHPLSREAEAIRRERLRALLQERGADGLFSGSEE